MTEPAQRREDDALVRGLGHYTDDAPPAANTLYVAFARSATASGRIESIACEDARAQPGVVAVITAHDLSFATLPTPNPVIAGAVVLPFEVLASQKVRAVGQPVAAVLAHSAAQANDAVEAILMSIDDGGPGSLEGQAASPTIATLAFGAPLPEPPPGAHRVSVAIAHPRLAPMAMEPRAIVATWDASRQHLTVQHGTQTPHRTRQDLAAALDLRPDQITVFCPDVGGAFGGKASVTPEEVFVAWAAYKYQASVRWAATRSEEFLASPHGRATAARGTLIVDPQGRIVGLEAAVTADCGHWQTFSALTPVRNAARILPGPYLIPQVHATMTVTASSTATVGIYRGAGRPEAAMVLERLMDEAAAHLGQDPLAFRQQNCVPKSALPFRLPSGDLVCSGDFAGLLETLSTLADYPARRANQAQRRAAGQIVGHGIALYIEPCGTGPEDARVRLRPDGGFDAATGTTAQGQGRATTTARVVANVLGVAPHQVAVALNDTRATESGIGALASRGTAIGSSAVHQAATELRRHIAQAVARQLNCAPEDLVFSSTGATAPQLDRHISWRDIAALDQFDVALRYTPKGEAWSSGACLASVVIDRDTGQLTVEDMVWVDDPGTVVEPTLAKGQLIGGLAQGLGEALMERIVYDANGQLLTGSLMDYAVPRAANIPPLTLATRATPSPMNVLGAKGVGEAGPVAAPAALLNAAIDALRPFGITHLDLPLTSARLWHALQTHAASDPKV